MKAVPSDISEFVQQKVIAELAASSAATHRARAKIARRLVVRSTAYGLVNRTVTVAKLEAKHGESPLSRRLARRLASALKSQSAQLINTITAS